MSEEWEDWDPQSDEPEHEPVDPCDVALQKLLTLGRPDVWGGGGSAAAVATLLSLEDDFWSFLNEHGLAEGDLRVAFDRFVDETRRLQKTPAAETDDVRDAYVKCLGLALMLFLGMHDACASDSPAPLPDSE